ncbi:MAG: hypothetical protein JXB48_06060, partial [Candidatus Latescibacteria bacterium]|nr:hypothetical protein [Candidatus Latescibacterota bacterium]
MKKSMIFSLFVYLIIVLIGCSAPATKKTTKNKPRGILNDLLSGRPKTVQVTDLYRKGEKFQTRWS